MPYSTAPKLLTFIQKFTTLYDQKMIKNADISRVLVPQIASKCIGAEIKSQILNKLREVPFAILTDVGSDYYGTSYLSVCVRFLGKEDLDKPTTQLFSIIEVGEDASGESLFEKIQDCLLMDDELIINNCMAVVTDQASSMIGPYKGLSTRIQENYPHVANFNDLSHIYNLICKYAVTVFPENIITGIKRINAHFKRSPQKKSILKRIQLSRGRSIFLNVISYTQVRWLSLVESVERIIDIWTDLKLYFDEFGDSEEKKFFSLQNEAYLRMLLILLDQLTFYNKIFQGTDLTYEKVLDSIQDSFRVFCNFILKEGYKQKEFEELINLNWQKDQGIEGITLNEAEFLILWNRKYPDMTDLLNKLNLQTKRTLIKTAQEFIYRVIFEMKDRLPFNNEIINEMQVVFLKEFKASSWEFLRDKFSNIIKPEEKRAFTSELNRMEVGFARIRKEFRESDQNITKTWLNLSIQYPYMSKLARATLILPYSTVSVERIFAQIPDIKTPKRSRMTVENLEACLLINQDFGKTDSFVNENMLARYQNIWKDNSRRQKSQLASNQVSNSPDQKKTEILSSAVEAQSFGEIMLKIGEMFLNSPGPEPINQLRDSKNKESSAFLLEIVPEAEESGFIHRKEARTQELLDREAMNEKRLEDISEAPKQEDGKNRKMHELPEDEQLCKAKPSPVIVDEEVKEAKSKSRDFTELDESSSEEIAEEKPTRRTSRRVQSKLLKRKEAQTKDEPDEENPKLKKVKKKTGTRKI